MRSFKLLHNSVHCVCVSHSCCLSASAIEHLHIIIIYIIIIIYYYYYYIIPGEAVLLVLLVSMAIYAGNYSYVNCVL